MQRYLSPIAAQSHFGYTLIRLMTGIVLTFHGYQKVFVIHLSGVAGFFEKIGIPLPQITGPFIGLLELVGGVLLFFGIFTRLLGLLFAIEFVVASYAAWILLGKGYAGSELELMLLFSCILIATNGPGRHALDVQLKLDS